MATNNLSQYRPAEILANAALTSELSVALSNIGNTSGATGFATNQLVLAGGNNVTLAGSTLAGSMTVSINGPIAPQQSLQTQSIIQGIRAGSTSVNNGVVSFANANNVSFGINGLTITASVSGVGGGGVGGGGVAVSAGTNSTSTSTVVFSNANNVTFGMNSLGVITASASAGTVSGGTINTLAVYATGANTTGSSTATYYASALSIIGGGIISIGNSNGSLVISAPQTANVSLLSVGMAAGQGNTLGNTGLNANQLVLAGGNNVTLSGSTNSTGGMTISVIGGAGGGGAGGAQSAQTIGFYGTGNTTNGSGGTIDARSMSIVGGGIVSVGYANGSIVISAPSATTGVLLSAGASNIGNFAGNTGVASNQLVLVGGSNITLSGSTSAGSMTLSIVGGAGGGVNGQSNQTVGIFAGGSNTTGGATSTYDARSLSFVGGGIISIGNSNGSIVVSAPGTTTSPLLVVGASNIGNTLGTTGLQGKQLVLAGGSNITLSGSTDSNGQTLSFIGGASGAGGGTVGYYVTGNTTDISSGTFDQRSMTMVGAGLVTVGYSNGSIIVSGPATTSAALLSVGLSNIGNSLGNSGLFTNQVVFAGGSNITLSGSSSAGSMTINIIGGAGGGGGAGGAAILAGTNSSNAGTVSFANSNGVSFGMNASGVVTATVIPGPAAGIAALQAGNISVTSGTLSFSNANNLSFGLAGQVLTGSVPAISSLIGVNGISVITTGSTISIVGGGTAGGGGVALSAGTNSTSTGTVLFSNQNGISFGMNSSGVVTASYTVPTTFSQTAQTLNNIQGISAGTTSANTGNIVFSNGNGLSFGLAGQTLTGSVPASSSLVGANGITISTNGNTISIVGGVGTNGAVISAGTNSQNTGTVSFINSNGISFGMNSSGGITASYTVPSGGTGTFTAVGGIALSAGTNISSTGTVVFSNSNNVTFGMNSNGAVTASATFLQTVQPQTVQTQSNIQAIQAGTASANTGAISFSNANGVSFGLSGQTLTGSVPGTSSIVGVGGISIVTTGSTIQVSYGGTAAGAGGVVVSAGSNSQNTGTVSFANSNGLSFGLNTNGALTGSYTVPSTVPITFINSNGISFGSNTASAYTASYTVPAVPAQTAQTQSNIQAIQAGTTSANTGAVSFSNANGVSFGLNGQTLTGSVVVAPAQSVQTQSNIQAIFAGSTSANTGAISFSNANGVSFGLSGQTLTGSVPALSQISATGLLSISSNGNTLYLGVAGSAQNVWVPQYGGGQAAVQYGNGVVQVFPAMADGNYTASRADIYINATGSSSSNSSYGGTLSVAVGFYTRNGSTLSLASSGSQSYAFTNTSNNSTANLYGIKNLSLPLNINVAEQDLWVGVLSQTASVGNNWFSASNLVYVNQGISFGGQFGAAVNASNQSVLGLGQLSVTTSALPSSIAFSNIQGTGLSAQLSPVIAFHNVSA